MDGSCLGLYRSVLDNSVICGMGARRIRLSVEVVLYNTWPFDTWSVGVKPPETPFREMFPSLQRLSIVIDWSKIMCPKPVENNTSFEQPPFITDLPDMWFVGIPAPHHWRTYLRSEYSGADRRLMPTIDVQHVARKKEKTWLLCRNISFYFCERSN